MSKDLFRFLCLIEHQKRIASGLVSGTIAFQSFHDSRSTNLEFPSDIQRTTIFYLIKYRIIFKHSAQHNHDPMPAYIFILCYCHSVSKQHKSKLNQAYALISAQKWYYFVYEGFWWDLTSCNVTNLIFCDFSGFMLRKSHVVKVDFL